MTHPNPPEPPQYEQPPAVYYEQPPVQAYNPPQAPLAPAPAPEVADPGNRKRWNSPPPPPPQPRPAPRPRPEMSSVPLVLPGPPGPPAPPAPPAPPETLYQPVPALAHVSEAVSVELHYDDDEEFEATVVLPRGNTATKWQLIDLDGTAYALHPANVFGRKPSPKDTPEKAQLVSLSDAERVLSRTHALLEVDNDTLYVTDLTSTNGTDLLDASGALLLECEPQVRVAVPAGGSLSLGGRAVTFASLTSV